MEVTGFLANGAILRLSHEELLIVNAALNEIRNGIGVQEFETRIGASQERVKRLHDEIRAAIDQRRATR